MPSRINKLVGVESIDLDELEKEAKKLVTLLEGRQPGLHSWLRMTAEQIDVIHKLIG